MPTTVNGIGTQYYGKKNVTVRTATCASCHCVGALESYDTRLWFVIIFIPVIPLGRKRIMDECPSCHRHYVASADVYEQAKQLQTSGSLEQYHREPSPETALWAHGQFLAFREHEQAADFRKEALQRFPTHAGLRSGMAQQLRDMFSHQESDQLFREAFDLDPSDPGARAGVALRKMADGDLDAARALLDFLEEPGAGQHHNLGPLDILAGYYQRAGRHEEALQVTQVLMREWPKAGNLHSFRAFIRKSEKALGRTESILPPRQFSLLGLFRSQGSPYSPGERTLAIGATVVALLVLGLALNNEYIRRHRTLHVLNATGAPAQVQVDDEPAVAIQGHGQLTLGEGPHTIKVSGPVEETHNIEMESGYFARWFSNPAWVLNPGSEAVLMESHIVYAQNPPPSQQHLIVGDKFFARPHYDYVFEKAPDRISLRNKTDQVTKTELDWLKGQDVGAFHMALQGNPQGALDFAERRLRRHPEDTKLLKAYLTSATDADRPRAQALLKAGLDRRPVNVLWHRAYQTSAERNVPQAELSAQYDRYLAAEPSSGALLYLRGRVDLDWDKQEAYYRKAAAADPQLAWPWIGLAWRYCAAGQWKECLAAAQKAKEHPVEDADLLNEALHTARLALGEAETLVSEYRARLDTHALDPVALICLIDALVVTGKASEIDAVLATWETSLPNDFRSQASAHFKAFALYQAGQLKECEALCEQTPALQHTPTRVDALLALGSAKKVADDPGFAKVCEDPWNALALSLALSLDTKDDPARWRSQAVEKFQAGAADWKRIAKIVGAAEAPSLKDLAQLHARPAEKALLVAALAARFPAKEGDYLPLAATMNVRRTPHYHLVRRALDRKEPPKKK